MPVLFLNFLCVFAIPDLINLNDHLLSFLTKLLRKMTSDIFKEIIPFLFYNFNSINFTSTLNISICRSFQVSNSSTILYAKVSSKIGGPKFSSRYFVMSFCYKVLKKGTKDHIH